MKNPFAAGRDYAVEFWRGAKAGYSQGYVQSAAAQGYMAAPPVPPGDYHGVETPGYHVVERLGAAEVRSYGLRLYAMRIVQDMATQTLAVAEAEMADYFAGANRKGQVFAQTTPMLLSVEGKHVFWRMGLPAAQNNGALPDAINLELRFATAHPGKMLVMEMPIDAAPEVRMALGEGLRAQAVAAGYDPFPEVLFLFYRGVGDGPWVPKRAEVAILL